jgi:hypothetical protein
MFADLLSSARTRADDVWLNRFLQCFADLRQRFATGDVPSPGVARCTGEEYALHLVSASVEAGLRDSWSETVVDRLAERFTDLGQEFRCGEGLLDQDNPRIEHTGRTEHWLGIAGHVQHVDPGPEVPDGRGGLASGHLGHDDVGEQ